MIQETRILCSLFLSLSLIFYAFEKTTLKKKIPAKYQDVTRNRERPYVMLEPNNTLKTFLGLGNETNPTEEEISRPSTIV